MRAPKTNITGPLPSPRPLVLLGFAKPSAIEAPSGRVMDVREPEAGDRVPTQPSIANRGDDDDPGEQCRRREVAQVERVGREVAQRGCPSRRWPATVRQ